MLLNRPLGAAPCVRRGTQCSVLNGSSAVSARTANIRATGAGPPACNSTAIPSRSGRRLGVSVQCALQVAVAPTAAAPGVAKVKELCNNRYEDAGLVMRAEQIGNEYQVSLRLEQPRGMILHWAVDEWKVPPQGLWPANTRQADDKACQTPFSGDGTINLRFSHDIAPQRLVFVLKQTQPEEAWFNNNGANYMLQLRAPPLNAFVTKVMEAEGKYTHWSLVQRLQLATELLEAADSAGPSGMALIYTWLRLSSTRVLDWYRNSNAQSKDIAHMQKYCAERMAHKARGAEEPLSRFLARQTMAGLPRGGGNGDDIRMGILHIMRGNGIKEGHRPGHEEPFLEEWHQKLHTNTTPDDIIICEAYLAFLQSGNHDDYFRVLWDNGRLTKEKMASWTKPIKSWPHHLPHLIGPFKGYLWTLKVTHAGADLDTAMEMAKGHVDDDLRWHLYDLLNNRNEWWAPGKVVEVRERLAQYWKAQGASRDLVLLDCGLENWLRTCVERTDIGALQPASIATMVSLVLRNARVTMPEDEDIATCAALWTRLTGDGGNRWGEREWAQAALAAVERTQLMLANHCDAIYKLVQPYADMFGEACKLDKAHITNFGEEVVRGLPLSMLAPLLQRLEPVARGAAGGGAWQIVSLPASPASGAVVAIGSLADVQGQSYATPTLLLATALTGVEDIPPGVVAVLTRSSTDVLSHLAIRARSQGVLLASCFDEAEWQAWQAKAGSNASASVDAAAAIVLPKEPLELSATASPAAATATGPKIQIQAPAKTDAWAIQETEFKSGLVGAKGLNLATLRAGLPQSIGVPASVSLPFGTFERVLAEGGPANAAAAARLAELQGEALKVAQGGALPREQLQAIRELVADGLSAPPALVEQLAAAASAQGLIGSPTQWAPPGMGQGSAAPWPAVWAAVCRVWASKWTDRAWLSRRAQGLQEEDVFMSVLLQQVVPVHYAYVLHTSNPIAAAHGSNPDEMLGEVVVGMGETLVGNYPGRALGFTAAPGAAAQQLLSLPSKRVALHAPTLPGGAATLIARSDANAEDLEQYAAAGLYDSVTLQPLEAKPTNYSEEALWWDGAFRAHMISGLSEVGSAVRGVFGGKHQDVEGGWLDGKFYVVQARPQV